MIGGRQFIPARSSQIHAQRHIWVESLIAVQEELIHE